MTILSPTAKMRPAGGASAKMLTQAYDLGFLCLAIMAASEGMGRVLPASLLWLGVYALALFRLATSPQLFLDAFRRNLVLFLFPLVCLASTAWSYNPKATLVSSIQLLMTVVIALYAGRRFSLRHICLATVLVVALPILLSLVNSRTGMFGPAFADGGGLIGIFTQKNLLGKCCLVALLGGLALLLDRRGPAAVRLFVVLPIMGASFVALAMSQSITPLLLFPMVAGLMVAMSYRSFPASAALLVVLGSVVFVAVFPMILAALGIDPITEVLSSVGKNSTLTGRTDIWRIGDHILAQYWPIGVGYNAFWVSPRFSSYAFAAKAIGGENIAGFHNIVYEVWIATGLAGLAAMTALVGRAFSACVRLWTTTRSTGSAFGFCTVLALVLGAMLDPVLYRQHELSIFLVVMIAVSANTERRQILARRARAREVGSDEA